jgi:hypothetical protein
MNQTDLTWAVGRPTFGLVLRAIVPLRVYGSEKCRRPEALFSR